MLDWKPDYKKRGVQPNKALRLFMGTAVFEHFEKMHSIFLKLSADDYKPTPRQKLSKEQRAVERNEKEEYLNQQVNEALIKFPKIPPALLRGTVRNGHVCTDELKLQAWSLIDQEFWQAVEKTAEDLRLDADDDFFAVHDVRDAMSCLAEALLISGYQMTETRKEKKKRYLETKKAATSLRRLLSNEPRLKYRFFSDNLFTRHLILDKTKGSEMTKAVVDVSKADLNIIQLLANIEQKYSIAPEDQYVGKTRPTRQRVFAMYLTEWFRVYSGSPHTELCLSAVSTVLSKLDPNTPLVANPLKTNKNV